MPGTSKTFAIIGLLALGACTRGEVAPALPDASAPAARNVILMIADGGGVAYWSAARRAAGRLSVAELPVVGLVDTWDVEGRVTDSAAAASAYATGQRTYYHALSVAPECQAILWSDTAGLRSDPARCPPVETLFQVAEARGMATGLVTTTYVVDATPAAFVAPSPDRAWYDLIARRFADADLEVLLGGGRAFLDGSRPDGADVLGRLCDGAACLATPAELRGYRADDRPLVGLFAPEEMAAAGARSPALPEMVAAALDRLGRHPGGFVAMFENEGTDAAGHSNQPLPVVVAEVLEFDRAVGVALDFARANPGTLLVVTSDHETGGLALRDFPRGDTLAASYIARSHTGSMVPLFAFGPGAERFAGIKENAEVGRLLREAIGNRQ